MQLAKVKIFSLCSQASVTTVKLGQPKDGAAVVEFVTTPNNHCDYLRNEVTVGTAAKQRRKLMVHDMSYTGRVMRLE